MGFLLRSELAVAPPLPEKKGSTEETVKEPGTLLETWTDGMNKKRTKRGTAPETVRNLADTRGQILDRARALLNDRQSPIDGEEHTREHVGDGMPPPTQTFGESALARSKRLQQDTVQPIAFASTQQFAPSRLAQSAIGTTKHGEPSIPPPTQNFAPSRLGTAISSTRIFDTTNEPSGSKSSVSSLAIRDSNKTHNIQFITSPSRSVNAASPTSRRTGSPCIDRHSSSAIDLSYGSESPHHGGYTTRSPTHTRTFRDMDNVVDKDVIEYDGRPEDWGMDEAYLHFDPDVPNEDHAQPAVEPRWLSPAPSRLAVPTREVEPRETATQEPEETAAVLPTQKPRSRKGKQPASSAPVMESVAEVTDTEFESGMHAAITQDKALHLRIIRYEASLLPIRESYCHG